MSNHLWQSTLFAIVAWLLTIAFRKNRAQVRHWLWFGASFKFLVPFSLLMTLGGQLERTPAGKKLATKIAPPAAVSITMIEVSQPFAEPMPRAPSNRDWTIPAILTIWAAGFFSVTLMRFRAWMRIRAVLRASTPADIPLVVEVRSSPGLLEPGVVGLLRPVLLLPAGIAERLTPAQLQAVLAHELCHIRRRDNLLSSLHMIVEAIFWFHPLVWWIGSKLVEERELACDQEVLRLGAKPREYAEGIVNVCKLYVESPLACVSGVTGSNLRKRIEGIMMNRVVLRLNFAKRATLTLAGVAALALPITLGVVYAPLVRAQATPKFETASIKRCSSRPGFMRGAGFSASDGKLNTGCIALADTDSTGLIERAYVRFSGGLPHFEVGIIPIAAAPDWIHTELFEIEARSDGNPSPGLMQGPMLQSLLEDRFKLKIHRETREVPVYALTLEQGNSGLKPFAEGSCVPPPTKIPFPELAPGQQYCKLRVGAQPPLVDAQGTNLAELAHLLDLVLDRPVIDKTGTNEKFDIHLEFAPDATTPRFLPGGDLAFSTATAALPIFSALHQLGLKLEPTTGPREFLVIDHVERLTEN